MIRDDIYLCFCCYKFFDNLTDKEIDVPYHEMPAELAMELMIKRKSLTKKKGKKKMHK